MHGIPEIIRSNDGSELKEEKFNEISKKRCIKQELTYVDRPQLNGAAVVFLSLIR